MAVIDQLLQLFARSILAKAAAHRSPTLTENQRKWLRSSITSEIRHCGLLLYPEVIKPEVSEAALKKADSFRARMKNKDLRNHTWHSQSSFDPGRKHFHWEHMDPISAIQKSCEDAGSEEEIQQILRTRLRIAWILKEEDEKLTKLGFRNNRPDPASAYQEAGIVLVKFPKVEAELPVEDSDANHTE
jgi:hypothetical protein